MNGYLQQQGLNRVQFSMQSCSSWFSVPSSTCVRVTPSEFGRQRGHLVVWQPGDRLPRAWFSCSGSLWSCGVGEDEPWTPLDSSQVFTCLQVEGSLEQGMSPALGCPSKFQFLGAGNVPGSWVPLQIPIPSVSLEALPALVAMFSSSSLLCQLTQCSDRS